MKALALVLCLALPALALAQPADAPVQMVTLPAADVIAGAEQIQGLKKENAELKAHMPENPVVVIACAAGAALLVGIALGVVIERQAGR